MTLAVRHRASGKSMRGHGPAALEQLNKQPAAR